MTWSSSIKSEEVNYVECMVRVINIRGQAFHNRSQNFIMIGRNVLGRATTSRYYRSSGVVGLGRELKVCRDGDNNLFVLQIFGC